MVLILEHYKLIHGLHCSMHYAVAVLSRYYYLTAAFLVNKSKKIDPWSLYRLIAGQKSLWSRTFKSYLFVGCVTQVPVCLNISSKTTSIIVIRFAKCQLKPKINLRMSVSREAGNYFSIYYLACQLKNHNSNNCYTIRTNFSKPGNIRFEKLQSS